MRTIKLMRDDMLESIKNFSKDSCGELQPISASVFGFLTDAIIEDMKNKGYIQKTDLEIAEDEYEEWALGIYEKVNFSDELSKFIYELKKEIKRLEM